MSAGLEKLPLHRHPEPHVELIRRHRIHWAHPDSRTASIISFLLFLGSVTLNYFAELYAAEHASNYVTDIVLSNTPAINVDDFFVYGAVALIVFITLVLMANPKRLPFTLHSFTLFYLIRAMFISLTHLGPFPVHTVIDFGTFISSAVFGGGMFFSGHTGAPFLMALLFWEQKTLRYIFILWSLAFATSALLGHLHYTIDVVSAYFITYTIFHISEIIFKKDHELFHGEMPVTP